jgi:hypothetical protein
MNNGQRFRVDDALSLFGWRGSSCSHQSLGSKPSSLSSTMAKKSTLPTQTSTLNKYFSKPGPSSAARSPSAGPSRSNSNRPTPSKRPRLLLEKEWKGDGMTAQQPVCLVDSSDEDEDEDEVAVARKVGRGKAAEDPVENDKGKGKVKEEAIVIDLDDDEEEKVAGREKDKGKGKGRARQDEDDGDELGEFMAGVEVVNSVDGSDSTVSIVQLNLQ